VWSLEELQICHDQLHSDLDIDVLQRYEAFGGMARYVVGDKADTPFEILANSLTSEQAKALYYMRLEGMESDIRHVFTHIDVSVGGQPPSLSSLPCHVA
jgi:hypothetical protein